ncbi:MAG: Ycf66 family protein [Cyanobacteria bacterium P01_G01_bin.38]
MLANLLAIVVGLGSFTFYMAAFFLPEVHRKSDFLWSGIGLFYALVLWFCAGQMTGAVLLGQSAVVSLVLWLGWQTLLLRRATTPPAQQTPVRIARGGGGRPRLENSPRGRIDLEYEFVEDASGGNRPVAQREEAFSEPPEGLPEIPPVDVVPAAIAGDVEAASNGIGSGGTGKDAIAPSTDSDSPSASLDERQPATFFNPFKKVLILAGWLKEVVTDFRKPKPAKPMIELPPRPRSIPKADSADVNIDKPDKPESSDTSTPDEIQAPTEIQVPTEIQTPEEFQASAEAHSAATQAEASPPAEIATKVEPPPPNLVEDVVEDEDANWPDDL